jgi:hypothetical protein
MEIDNKPESFGADRDVSDSVNAETKRPRRFLMPWRLKSDVHLLWQQGDDAGCGQATGD